MSAIWNLAHAWMHGRVACEPGKPIKDAARELGLALGDIIKLASNENPLGPSPKALVMHCLPAYRGKEISAETLELHADTLFVQAENRLHAQKAVLQLIAGKR